jgi:PAS domain S-box-containing protein
MKYSESENRLRELELEMSNLKSIEIEATLQKELSFRQAIENSIPSGIAVMDDTGRQVYVNQSFCKMVGWDEEELLDNQPPFVYWAKQDIDSINNALKRTLENSVPKEGFDLIFQHKSGKLIPVNIIITSFIQENNRTFWLANVIDLTERKNTETALKESETKFREILNQINDAIIVFDQEGKIIIWNKGAEQLCGLKAGEILNQSIADIQYQFTPPPNNDRTSIENVIKGMTSFKTPELFNQIIDSEMITLNSDKIRNIQSMVFPIRLNDSYLFCTVIRDTTEIKQYEKELMRISGEKDKFYSVIAQYLYNPFNLFHNFTKIMAEELDTLSIKEIQKMVVTMSKSATNLYSLLDNMLQYTRINQGKISFQPQELNFVKISHETVAILKPNADAKNITITYKVENNLEVYADMYMLKTILRNLISNAIKFTDVGGQIIISAIKSISHITISVADNGIGITPEYLTKIFSISQIQSTLGTSEERGTTLGLLLCKEFVEKHGGRIWVENENRKGSEFKFSIPLLNGASV